MDTYRIVWNVHSGCMYEGGSTKAVCSTHQKAVWYAKWLARRGRSSQKYKRYTPSRDYYPGDRCQWQRDLHIEGEYCNYPRTQRDIDYWENGSDIITIYEIKLL